MFLNYLKIHFTLEKSIFKNFNFFNQITVNFKTVKMVAKNFVKKSFLIMVKNHILYIKIT